MDEQLDCLHVFHGNLEPDRTVLVQGGFDERTKIDGLVRNRNDCLGNQIENWRDKISSLAVSFKSLEDRNNRMEYVR
jgi:hypothetical protein